MQVLRLECVKFLFFCTRIVVGYRRENGIFVRFGGEKISFLCLVGHRSVVSRSKG